MFNGDKILVVGAGGLLGSRLVAELVRVGAKPIAADLNVERSISRLSAVAPDIATSEVEFAELDICDEEGVKKFFSSLVNVSGIVNCSYPRGPQYGKPFFDVSLNGFNENVSLHLGSAFLLMREAARYFLENLSPLSFVNISSIYGVVAPKFDVYRDTHMTMPVEYAAIKSAIIHLTKYVAAFVKDSKFRVNSVSPGGLLDGQPSKFCESYRNHCLGKGMLEVGDVLGAITFLLSDMACYVNGQNIVVDDGFSL